MPFLTHNMARPPTDFCAACLPGYRRCKIPDATLSGSTIFLSVEASTRANGLFLPHIMAANRLRKHQGKKGKKGHARLCDSTVCAFVLCFPRLRKDLRHIIWLESADNHVKPQGSKRIAATRHGACSGYCEYCRCPTKYSAQSFAVEHIIPRHADDPTVADNLALACQGCNAHKSIKIMAVDPITSVSVPLFHPRQHRWRDHFSWSEDFAGM